MPKMYSSLKIDRRVQAFKKKIIPVRVFLVLVTKYGPVLCKLAAREPMPKFERSPDLSNYVEIEKQ